MNSKKLRKSTVTAGIATGPLLIVITYIMSQFGLQEYANEVAVVVATLWGLIVSLLDPNH